MGRFEALTGYIVLLVCLFSGLLVVLAWAQFYGSTYTEVAQGLTKFMFFIIAVVSIMFWIWYLITGRER
jgi:hypothetical protein